MPNDKAMGGALLAVSIIVIIVYAWLVFFSPWKALVIEATAFIGVAAVFGILAWIGYALATTPPPKPIEEIEKEIQEELNKLEKETKEGEGAKQ
ncbi:transcriptional regulator [Thermocladium modestius]|nr:transcriptional regulator [Thermocladium modestius]